MRKIAAGILILKIPSPANLASSYRSNFCSKKDDTLVHKSSYKIIVGSATDTSGCLLYRK